MGLFTRKKKKQEFTDKEITEALHSLMDYTFGEVDNWLYLTKNEKLFLNPRMFRFLKAKKFKSKKLFYANNSIYIVY